MYLEVLNIETQRYKHGKPVTSAKTEIEQVKNGGQKSRAALFLCSFIQSCLISVSILKNK